jgi:hypothetical protein
MSSSSIKSEPARSQREFKQTLVSPESPSIAPRIHPTSRSGAARHFREGGLGRQLSSGVLDWFRCCLCPIMEARASHVLDPTMHRNNGSSHEQSHLTLHAVSALLSLPETWPQCVLDSRSSTLPRAEVSPKRSFQPFGRHRLLAHRPLSPISMTSTSKSRTSRISKLPSGTAEDYLYSSSLYITPMR